MKKTLLFLIFAALLPSVNAADLQSFMQENSASVDAFFEANTPKSTQPVYKYNYKPIVFEITTENYRSIYCNMGEDADGRPIRADLSRKQDGLCGEGAGYYKAKCYGTLINNKYILTHKNCVSLPEMEYKDSSAGDANVSFEPLTMTFEKDGRELQYDMKDVKDVFIDNKSGAALLNIGAMCFHKKGTTASNVCMEFLEWVVNSDKETFKIPANYGTYILSNIETKDNVKDSFLKRIFFTPTDDAVKIKDVKNGLVIPDAKVKKSLAGEPLFHRADGSKNILVGIRTADPVKEEVIKYTKSNTFALFSPKFTELVKQKLKTDGIKLTKDLNGTNML